MPQLHAGVRTSRLPLRVPCKKALNGSYKTARYTLQVTELPNGTYYLKNKQTERNADIENQSMSDGTQIHQWEFHGGKSQRWEFRHLGDGYYSVKSDNASTPYYLGVSGDSSAYDVAVVLRTGSLTSGMKWKISKTPSYAYKITPRTGEANNRVLAVGVYQNNTNGIDIQQWNYVEDENFKDEWYIASTITIGFSTDNYTDGCSFGERQSYRYANKFFDKLISSPGTPMFDKVHHYNKGSVRTASKNDFAVNGAISNDIDFMIYIGHGLQASNSNGNYLHYNCATGGNYHTNDCSNPVYNAYHSELNFGSDVSDLRWVWLYTCNFLKYNDYVTQETLKRMMTGAHIVMGYGTQACLCDPMVETFANHLREGLPIIEAYFRAGREGEASVTSDENLQRVMYIPQAEKETIYSPRIDYEYDFSDVLFVINNIQGG